MQVPIYLYAVLRYFPLHDMVITFHVLICVTILLCCARLSICSFDVVQPREGHVGRLINSKEHLGLQLPHSGLFRSASSIVMLFALMPPSSALARLVPHSTQAANLIDLHKHEGNAHSSRRTSTSMPCPNYSVTIGWCYPCHLLSMSLITKIKPRDDVVPIRHRGTDQFIPR